MLLPADAGAERTWTDADEEDVEAGATALGEEGMAVPPVVADVAAAGDEVEPTDGGITEDDGDGDDNDDVFQDRASAKALAWNCCDSVAEAGERFLAEDAAAVAAGAAPCAVAVTAAADCAASRDGAGRAICRSTAVRLGPPIRWAAWAA